MYLLGRNVEDFERVTEVLDGVLEIVGMLKLLIFLVVDFTVCV